MLRPSHRCSEMLALDRHRDPVLVEELQEAVFSVEARHKLNLSRLYLDNLPRLKAVVVSLEEVHKLSLNKLVLEV